MITVFLALICVAAVVAIAYILKPVSIETENDCLEDSLKDSNSGNNSSVAKKETVKAAASPAPAPAPEKKVLTFEEALEKNKEWMAKHQEALAKATAEGSKAWLFPVNTPGSFTWSEVVTTTKPVTKKTPKKKTKKATKRVKKEKLAEKPVTKIPLKKEEIKEVVQEKKKPVRKRTKKIESPPES